MIILHLCLGSFIIMNTCHYNCGEQATSLHAVTAYLVDKRVDCISGKTVWSLVHTCHTWTTWGWVIRGNALYKSTVTLLTLRRFYDSAHRSLLLVRTESVLKRRRHQTPGGSRAPVPHAWRRHCLYCSVITDGVDFCFVLYILQYDEKLKKLQRQLSDAQVPASKQLATNQEIFRMVIVLCYISVNFYISLEVRRLEFLKSKILTAVHFRLQSHVLHHSGKLFTDTVIPLQTYHSLSSSSSDM